MENKKPVPGLVASGTTDQNPKAAVDAAVGAKAGLDYPHITFPNGKTCMLWDKKYLYGKALDLIKVSGGPLLGMRLSHWKPDTVVFVTFKWPHDGNKTDKLRINTPFLTLIKGPVTAPWSPDPAEVLEAWDILYLEEYILNIKGHGQR